MVVSFNNSSSRPHLIEYTDISDPLKQTPTLPLHPLHIPLSEQMVDTHLYGTRVHRFRFDIPATKPCTRAHTIPLRFAPVQQPHRQWYEELHSPRSSGGSAERARWEEFPVRVAGNASR